ncbi:copper-translocating P-type ATPase [Deltaproteobacteria bacterium]|nr:copper-translocating P-type ATPase [Deltaproteobacteria bacterium]
MIPTASPVACPHCGTATELAGYCCTGCEVAAALLHDAGLDRYYAERFAPAPRPGAKAAVNLEVAGNGDTAEARFHVDGLTCASCVWVAETLLGKVPGVESVFVSYGTSNATVRFDPRLVDVARVVAPLHTVGWGVRPIGAAPNVDHSWLTRVGFSAFAAMNIMLISAGLYAGWFAGMDASWTTLFTWWSLVLATPVATWAALPFYRTAWAGLRSGRLHVDAPISLGVLAMFVHGLWAALAHHEGYLDSMAMLVALLLGARVLEQGGRRRAAEAARSLGALAPRTARRVRGGGVEEVPVGELCAGDHIVAAHGEELAADGVVVEGEADVQMALLTGESVPRRVRAGDEVVAGATLSTGNLVIEVARTGDDTLLGRMACRLAEALDRPIPPTLADRVAPTFTAITLLAAAGSALGWGLHSGPEMAMKAGIAVLVVACPCALALAAPLTASAALGAAARGGLLVRSGDVLRTLAKVDTVVFDKTGTLTEGIPRVTHAEDSVLRIAAGLERQSRHPIASAILAEAASRSIPLPSPRAVLERPGEGVVGEVDGIRYRLGRGAAGLVALHQGDRLVGTISLQDRVRPEARATVSSLRVSGVRVLLLSGDDPAVVARIAAEVGIDEAEGGVRPDDKAGRIAQLRSAGCTVLFVGDGVNDGPAMTAADVGVAMGAGAASTLLVADAVQVGQGLRVVCFGLLLARRAESTVRRSSLRSLVYNATAVTVAACGLMNPLFAALLMPLSSSLVIGSALHLGRISENK